jgi:hypothetical protein
MIHDALTLGLILVALIKKLDGPWAHDPGSMKRIPKDQIRNNDLE